MRNPPVKLLDRVRQRIRLKRYSIRTEKSYVSWIKRFILFHGKRHPRDMEKPEIEAFLSYLVMKRNVASSTQNQAFNAILLLYNHVLDVDMPEDINALRVWGSVDPGQGDKGPARTGAFPIIGYGSIRRCTTYLSAFGGICAPSLRSRNTAPAPQNGSGSRCYYHKQLFTTSATLQSKRLCKKSYSLHKSCSNPAFIHLSIVNTENLKLSSNLNRTGKCFRSFFLSSKAKLP